MAHGETKEKALKEIETAKELRIETALKAAEESGNKEEVRRIIDELSRMPKTALRTIRACLRRAPGDIMMFRS